MEKSAFACIDADPKWWLLQDESTIDSAIAEGRADIGGHLGWGRACEWYRESGKLEELYDLIERRESALLRELDDATDDDRRRAWMGKVADLTKPTGPEPAPAPGPEAAPVATAPEAAPGSGSATVADGKPAGPVEDKSGPTTPRADVHEPTPAATRVPIRVQVAVQQAMKHLAPANRGALAGELGVSADELSKVISDLPADFAAMVAAEVAALATK
jgi:hypothetical protein